MAFRTPDERFAPLPGWEHEPHYLEHDGLRIAWVDAGPADGPVVWLQHGEPTWGVLWRKVVAPLVAAGFRCVVPDLVGFGRSDKPERIEDYTFDAHVGWMGALAEHLDVLGGTLVVHDWGGPIGMRLFVEQPERWARIAILDTGFFTGEQRMTDAWKAFRDFVERTEDLPVGSLVDGATATALAPEVLAAYEAPFPTPASKAGARAFPLILPTDPDAPGAAAGRAVRDAMVADRRPKLLLWADGDPIIPLAAGRKMAELLGAPLEEVAGASHFLQEDAGEHIGARLVHWLRG
ncbi:MAG: alpha/beta fold hydrolase [Solirubrobacterales bacterium]|jgi:haloalkane dehalogenase|nr:alpha/beta fold hydrolase [Solirubrobacterales bacterium]